MLKQIKRNRTIVEFNKSLDTLVKTDSGYGIYYYSSDFIHLIFRVLIQHKEISIFYYNITKCELFIGLGATEIAEIVDDKMNDEKYIISYYNDSETPTLYTKI